ncbi:pilus assembly protein [Hahella sp. KA22]|uniref:pilus assembly PilX family protein n=1 Tax=Hahella sp. KA22 TaxID=1628392 RepID=UPI000FDE003B|nr:pilus assembly protein [Hahella sp. KA22]AZZ94361.1 pilus assembly protein [Hahella sp. KA22]QAY57735.1 pilus assembly protein [Hahella sp. KA22]
MLKKQSGAALFISLILLLVLTIIGLASMNDSVMQGKMSSAIQDSNLALHGVESAVREAESALDGMASPEGFGTTSGLYSETDKPAIYSKTLWTDDAKSIKAVGDDLKTSLGLNEEPRYIIQYVGQVGGTKDRKPGIDNYGHDTGQGEVLGFRIISRSTGGSGNSLRMVESYYGKRY